MMTNFVLSSMFHELFENGGAWSYQILPVLFRDNYWINELLDN